MISPAAAQYFWDIDPRTVDEKKHERFIISRLLNYGRLSDWQWLLRTYGRERIIAALRETRSGLREPVRRLALLMFS